MKNKKYTIIAVSALLLILWTAVIPAAAELEPDFDWEVYRIDTEKWTAYTNYIKYSGVIYEVHFTDETEGGTITAWDWEFSEDDWWGSTEQDPVYIYTEEEADEADYRFKVTLAVTDSDANHEDVSHYVYVIEDPWNVDSGGYPRTIYELTPEPTATPTTVPTTAPPTTVVTTIPTTPTPEPTEPPAFTLSLPVISDELTRLKTAYNDHLEVILQIFRNIGIVKG